MALQVLPILKALAPLIAEAGGMVAGMRSTGRATRVEERVEKLEREMLRAALGTRRASPLPLNAPTSW